MLIPPRRIVFTGGGLRSLGHLGALEYLQEKGLLKKVKEYIGVSAGALIGFCMMLGYEIKELQKAVAEFDFTILQNAHPEIILEFFSKYGVDSGELLEKFLVSLLRIKGHPIDMTFEDWALKNPRGLRFRCFACDLNTCEMKEFSTEKTPRISFILALRASMCLPMYFIPLKDPDTQHYLVDGGLIHNFPINFLTEDEKEEALGISFHYTKNKVDEITDFPGFLAQVYNCSFNPRTYQAQKENRLRCIVIPTGQMSAYNFDISKEAREELIRLGLRAAEEYCLSYLKAIAEHKKPIRRYSVG